MMGWSSASNVTKAEPNRLVRHINAKPSFLGGITSVKYSARMGHIKVE